ncbi:MAG: hypothetical protein KDE23_21665, partial [Caldilinea sp.]|nr:hypothetical protein [Caldilinea sp.]
MSAESAESVTDWEHDWIEEMEQASLGWSCSIEGSISDRGDVCPTPERLPPLPGMAGSGAG